MLNKSCVFLLFFILINGCKNADKVPRATIEPRCMEFQEKCEIKFGENTLHVQFDVEKLKPEQAFNIYLNNTLSTENIEYSGYMEGVTMYMGKIPLFFDRLDNNINKAEVMLGSCSTSKMTWRIWLIIKNKTTNTTVKKSIDIHLYS